MPASVLIDRTAAPDDIATAPGYDGHVGMGTGGPREDDPSPSSPTTGAALAVRMANFDAGKSPPGAAGTIGAGSPPPLVGRRGAAALPGLAPSMMVLGASRKSMNMTERVLVATSEHVAEIVGRQGSKIKALRAKTNTYIKTPVRGEEPVFVVTGRKEDVAAAKKEILAIAEHFSQIRAGRLSSNSGGRAISTLGFFSADIPGHVTIHVRVPYRVVGLVVGPKGATIKRIQQDSQTYIVTPSRDREPIFEVSGLSENVEKARCEIESYIALRTGTGIPDAGLKYNGKATPVMLRPFGRSRELDGLSSDDAGSQMLGSMFRPQLCGAFASSALASFNNSLNLGAVNRSHVMHNGAVELCGGPSHDFLAANKKIDILPQNCIGGPNVLDDYVAFNSSKTVEKSYCNDNDILKNQFWCQMSNVEAPWLLDSLAAFLPSAEDISVLQNEVPNGDYSVRALDTLNFTSSLKLFNNGNDDGSAKDTGACLLVNGAGQSYVAKVHSGSAGSAASNSPSVSPTDSVGSPGPGQRRCFVCGDNDIAAALVPCGHNLFCMECARAVLDRKDRPESRCPVCQQMASLAVRILS